MTPISFLSLQLKLRMELGLRLRLTNSDINDEVAKPENKFTQETRVENNVSQNNEDG